MENHLMIEIAKLKRENAMVKNKLEKLEKYIITIPISAGGKLFNPDLAAIETNYFNNISNSDSNPNFTMKKRNIMRSKL